VKAFGGGDVPARQADAFPEDAPAVVLERHAEVIEVP
jgi:hypothetical protein